MADRSSRGTPRPSTTDREVEPPERQQRADRVDLEPRRPPELPEDTRGGHEIGRVEGLGEAAPSSGEAVSPAGDDVGSGYGAVDLGALGPETDDPDLGVDLPDDSGPLGTAAGHELHGVDGSYSPADDITAVGPGWDDVTPEQMTGTIFRVNVENDDAVVVAPQGLSPSPEPDLDAPSDLPVPGVEASPAADLAPPDDLPGEEPEIIIADMVDPPPPDFDPTDIDSDPAHYAEIKIGAVRGGEVNPTGTDDGVVEQVEIPDFGDDVNDATFDGTMPTYDGPDTIGDQVPDGGVIDPME